MTENRQSVERRRQTASLLLLAALTVLPLPIHWPGSPPTAGAQTSELTTGPAALPAADRAAAEEYARQGAEHLARGAAALAIGDLEAAIEIDVHHGPALLDLGNAQVEVERFGPALRSFEQAVRLSPHLFQNSHHHAKAIAALGDHIRALTILDQILGNDPDHVEATYLSGRLQVRTGDVALGMQQLEHVLEMEPGHLEAAIEIGLAHLRSDDAERALEAFEYANSILVNVRAVLHGTIRSLELLGRKGAAATRTRQFESLEETWSGIDREHGRLLRNPREVEAYVRLGRHHLRLSHYVAATGNLETAIFLDPELVEAMLALGTAYSGQRMFAESEAILHEALQLEPDNPEIHRELAACYRYTKSFKLSERHQHRYVELQGAQADSGAAAAKRKAEDRRTETPAP